MQDIAAPANHITDDELEAAIAAGLVGAPVAQALRGFVIERRRASNMGADEENLRLLSGFNDIFVTLGIVLFLGALVFLNWTAGPLIVAAMLAAAAWALAEFFTRIKRLALPGIVLLCVFAGAILVTAGFGLSSQFNLSFDGRRAPHDMFVAAMPAAVTMIAVWLHWLRFRVPVTAAVGAMAFVWLALGLAAIAAPEFTLQYYNWLLLPLGLLTLALAMRFDMQDTARLTRQTDIAFWLHLLAAPMIVHSLVRGLGLWAGGVSLARALTIFVMFAFFSAFALIIDRRALLVSSLVYLGVAFGILVRETGVAASGSSSTALAVLMVGATVLLLSASWRSLRAALLRFMPVSVRACVPAAASV